MEKSGDIETLRGFATTYRDELPSGHETDLAHTFQMSWDLAPEAAKDVLRVMVELDIDGNPLTHRLLQAFARHRNKIDKTSHLARTATVIVEGMEATFNNPGAAELDLLETLVPHAEALASRDDLSPDNVLDLLGRLASHHQDMGRYRLAEDFARAAVDKAERSFEAGHPSIARSQSNLAGVLRDLGQLEEARDLLRKALASFEAKFEPTHASVVTVRGNLEGVLLALERKASAAKGS
jgi:tetratricopeptide (TPR) repeat protein